MLSQSQMWKTSSGPAYSVFSYFITQPFATVHYVITFFLPFNLSVDSDWSVIDNIFDDRVIIGFLFVCAMLYIAYINSKKKETRPISFGILWFLIALVPTSSFIPLSQVINDHRVFFPFVGLVLSVCWALGLLIIKNEKTVLSNSFAKGLIIVIAVGILGGHAYGTHLRNKVWETPESLWHDTVIKSPGNPRALLNYGLIQMGKGNSQKALEYLQKALAINPQYPYLHVNLGILKGMTNEPVEAEKYFKNALKFEPNNPEFHFHYARWLLSQNRRDEAISLLQRALQISPGHILSQNLLSEILSHPKAQKTAVEQAKEMAKSNPTAEEYLNLSLQHYNAGRFEDSIKACNRALEIKSDYDLAYNNMCAAYNALKIWDKAIEACEKGIKINPDNQLLKNNLAQARSQKALENR
jgi:tetratricopeptide (TPR) repeat protein